MENKKIIPKVSYIWSLVTTGGLVLGLLFPYIGLALSIYSLVQVKKANESDKKYVTKNQMIFMIFAVVALSMFSVVSIISTIQNAKSAADSSSTVSSISTLIKLIIN